MEPENGVSRLGLPTHGVGEGTPRILFVTETATDVRLIEGLAEVGPLSHLYRDLTVGVPLSQPTIAAYNPLRGPRGRLAFALSAFATVLRTRRSVDFVLIQGYGFAAVAANAAARLARLPAAMLVCSPVEAYLRCRRPTAMLRVQLLAVAVCARANALVGQRYFVLSDYLAGVVRARTPRAAVDKVPLYGVDTRVFVRGDDDRQVVRRRLGLPENGFVIFSGSRVAPEKDTEVLLSAFRRYSSSTEAWLVHCSGGHEEFAADAVEAGVGERVISRPAVHPHGELPDYYRAADVCVQASKDEGLGFTPLEALASGTPVIAASVGGLVETIRDGETGWTYPRGDSEALARCLAAVESMPDEAERRVRVGQEFVAARFDRRVVFAAFAEEVRESMDRTRAS